MSAVTDENQRPLAGLRILVVDDTAELAEILTFVLTREGAQVEAVGDGLSAVSRDAAESFDVVLMDIGLPGIDGLEACRRITTSRPGATVIMLSARDGLADRTAGTAAGATGYLGKPFAPRTLVAELQALLAAADRSRHAGD